MIQGSKGHAFHACMIRLLNLEPAKHKKVAIYVVNQRISNVCRIAGCFAAEQFVGISWGPSYFVPMIHGLLRISCSRNPSYFYRIISAGILQVNQTGIPILLLRNISQRKKWIFCLFNSENSKKWISTMKKEKNEDERSKSEYETENENRLKVHKNRG